VQIALVSSSFSTMTFIPADHVVICKSLNNKPYRSLDAEPHWDLFHPKSVMRACLNIPTVLS